MYRAKHVDPPSSEFLWFDLFPNVPKIEGSSLICKIHHEQSCKDCLSSVCIGIHIYPNHTSSYTKIPYEFCNKCLTVPTFCKCKTNCKDGTVELSDGTWNV